MKKRILSILLCLAMLAGVLPLGLFTLTAGAELYMYAEGGISGTTGRGTESDPVICDNYSELKQALEFNGDLYIRVDSFPASEGGPHYSLLPDRDYIADQCAITVGSETTKHLDINTTIVLKAEKLTPLYSFIDVCGTLYLGGTGELSVTFNNGKNPNAVFLIHSPGKLIADGSVTIESEIGKEGLARAVYNHSGSLEIKNGNYTGTNYGVTTSEDDAGAVVVGENAVDCTISGGKFYVTTWNGAAGSHGLCVLPSSKVTLYGGQYGGIKCKNNILYDLTAENFGYRTLDDKVCDVGAFNETKEIIKVVCTSYTKIQTVSINGMNLLIKNGDSVEDHVDFCIPKDAGYTVTDFAWVDEDYPVGKEFEKGEKYYAKWTLEAKDGYIFTESTEAEINGSTTDIARASALSGTLFVVKTNCISCKKTVALTGEAEVLPDKSVAFFGNVKAIYDKNPEAITFEWQAYIDGDWLAITESEKSDYDYSMLRVKVYADGYDLFIISDDLRYTNKDFPLRTDDFEELKRFFENYREDGKTKYVELSGDITYSGENCEMIIKSSMVLDLKGYKINVQDEEPAYIATDNAFYLFKADFYSYNGDLTINDSKRYDSASGEYIDGGIEYRCSCSNEDPGIYVFHVAVIGGKITLNGGVIKNPNYSHAAHESNYGYYGGNLKMYGGTIEGEVPVCLEEDVLYKECVLGLYGGTIRALLGSCILCDISTVKSNIDITNIRFENQGTQSRQEEESSQSVAHYSTKVFNCRYFFSIAGTEEELRARYKEMFHDGTTIYIDGEPVSNLDELLTFYDADSSTKNKFIQGPYFAYSCEVKTDTTLDDIDFTVSRPTFRGTPDYNITPASGEDYTTEVKWMYLSGDRYVEMKDGDIFHSDTNYRICIKIKSKSGGGVGFGSDFPISINGETAYYENGYYFTDFYIERRSLHSVTVGGYVERGEKIYSALTGADKFLIEDVVWYKNGERIIDTSAVVSQGKYRAYVVLKAENDYRFTEETTARFFGLFTKPDSISGGGVYAYFYTPTITIACDHSDDTSSWEYNSESHWRKCSDCAVVYGEAEHDFDSGTTVGKKTTYTCEVCGYQKITDNGKECIGWILLDADVSALAVGDKLPEIKVKDYDADKYTVTSYQWKAGKNADSATNVAVGTTISYDNNYYLIVKCTANTGYYIADDVMLKAFSKNAETVTVNSGKTTVDAQINKIYSYNKTTANIVLPTITVGKTMGDVLDEIKTSSLGKADVLGEIGAEFYINGVRYSYFFSPGYSTDWKENEGCLAYGSFKTMTVKPGTTYKLNIKLTPIMYYIGEEDITVTNESAADSVGVSGDSTVLAMATAIYTTEGDNKSISFINLGITEPEAGYTPASSAAAGTNCNVDSVEWLGTLKDGKFACENEYSVKITVSANGEYYFDETSVATVNGKTATITKSGDKCIITYDFAKLEHDCTKLCYDDTNHWKQCTASNCTEKTNITPHTFSGDICTVCGYTKAGHTVSGTVTSFGEDSQTVTVELYKAGEETAAYSATVTGNSTSYALSGVAPGTYTMKVGKTKHCTREYTVTVEAENVTQDVAIRLYGDISGDGKINITDATQAARQFSNMPNLISKATGDEQVYLKKVADVSGDGKINITDVTQIKRKFSNLPSLFDKLP